MLYDAERRWIDRGACVGAPPGIFFAPNASQLDRTPSSMTQAAWDEAKKICARCPVLEQCRRDTLGEEYGVFGGRDEHERYRERHAIARKRLWKQWPEAERLEWGEHLTYLRQQSITWREIQLRTGLMVSVCEGLMEQWSDHLKTLLKADAEVVDLPLPDEPLPRTATRRRFPDEPGRRHAWVRHQHLVADAYYGGQTADGKWIKMLCYSGRGMVIKWFLAEDVRFYHPQEPWIVKYPGRKDAQAA